MPEAGVGWFEARHVNLEEYFHIVHSVRNSLCAVCVGFLVTCGHSTDMERSCRCSTSDHTSVPACLYPDFIFTIRYDLHIYTVLFHVFLHRAV